MDGGASPEYAMLDDDALGRLMPMYLWVSSTGHIRSVGPTLAKLGNGRLCSGRRFLEVLEVRKPGPVDTMEAFRRFGGRRLHLAFRDPPATALRGHAVLLGNGLGTLINLSFGVGAAEAVREHALTNSDFAPTDLTVELLYLSEVKAAVMQELAALNERLRVAQRAAEAMAQTDALTGLANRRALDAALARAVEATARGAPGFALMHLDLDFFKAVNDTLGHAAGDFVLTRVAGTLRQTMRVNDLIARVGGDEFVMLLSGPIDEAVVAEIGARVIEGLERPLTFAGAPCRISGSLGATLSRYYARPDPDRMQSDADAALYAAKRGGRARCKIWSPPR
ncbi:MAG: GGDEF domain-containing protein [Paracoccaceae bacterium]